MRVAGSGDAVEEAEHQLQAALRVGDGDVRAGDRRGAVLRAELPAEADLVVVGVDGAGQAEREARELCLDGVDRRVDLLASLGLNLRVDVAGVGAAVTRRRAVGVSCAYMARKSPRAQACV